MRLHTRFIKQISRKIIYIISLMLVYSFTIEHSNSTVKINNITPDSLIPPVIHTWIDTLYECTCQTPSPELLVPIHVENLDSASVICLSIFFKNSSLQFNGVQYINPAISYPLHCIIMGITYTNFRFGFISNQGDISIPDSLPLLVMKFKVLCDTTKFIWQTSDCYYITGPDSAYSFLDAEFTEGLFLNGSTEITSQPADQTIFENDTAIFSCSGIAHGSPLIYQWQRWTDSSNTWNNVIDDNTFWGSNTTILNIAPTTTSLNTSKYRCLLSGHCDTIVTDMVSLYVNPLPHDTVKVFIQNINTCCSPDSSVVNIPVTVEKFTDISAFGFAIDFPSNGLNFNAVNLGTPSIGGTLTANQAGNQLVINWSSVLPVSVPDGTTIFTLDFVYTCSAPDVALLEFVDQSPDTVSFVSDVEGNILPSSFYDGYITKIQLGVMPPDAISPNTIVCAGQSQTFSVQEVINATGYNWDILLPQPPSAPIPIISTGNGTTSVTVLFPLTLTEPNYTIRCSAHDECGNESWDTAIITVNFYAQVNDPPDLFFCNNTTTNGVNFTTNNTTGTTTYSWTNSQPSIGLPAYGSGNIPSFTAINTGTNPKIATIIVVPHSTTGLVTCDGPSQTFSITVNPNAQVNDPVDQVVCRNSVSSGVYFTTLNCCSGTTTYAWTNDHPAIGSGACGTGPIHPFIALNSTDLPITATLTVFPSYTIGSMTCDGPHQTFTITVNPPPVAAGIITGPNTVCRGAENLSYSVPPIINATSYNWTLPNGFSLVSNNGNTITINVGTEAEPGFITVNGLSECGAGLPASLPVTIDTCISLSGTVTYNNSSNTPLNNTLLSLFKDNVLIDQTISANDGSYLFEGLYPGQYLLQAASEKSAGSINAADALLILKHFVGMENLQGLSLKAADVNASSYINSDDALLVIRYFVQLIDSFPLGSWVFDTDTIELTGATNVIYNFKGLCAGDVDASFIPPAE